MRQTAHVTDDRLVQHYFAGRHGEFPDPRVAEHLTVCPACSIRWHHLVALFDQTRLDAEEEIESVFPAGRRALLRQQIGRRLEGIGRSARILTFPTLPHGHRGLVRPTRILPRWLAAAAAAGLAVGVGVNMFLGAGAPRPRATARLTEPARMASAPTQALRGGVPEIDEAFLSDLEHAAEGPRTPELEAFDALTPHFIETVVSIRRLRP